MRSAKTGPSGPKGNTGADGTCTGSCNVVTVSGIIEDQSGHSMEQLGIGGFTLAQCDIIVSPNLITCPDSNYPDNVYLQKVQSFWYNIQDVPTDPVSLHFITSGRCAGETDRFGKIIQGTTNYLIICKS